MRVDGTASDWRWTFIREFVVFNAAGGVFMFGLGSVIDKLWAFSEKDRQTLHDKVMMTVVVDDHLLPSRLYESSPEVA